jgi:hypothetical protein
MLNPLVNKINPSEVFELQKQQYYERLLLSDTVTAGATKLGRVQISNVGHFMCMYITGSYSSLASPAGAIIDTGINYLSGQLIDGAGQRKLYNDRIPFDLWLSPGRRRDAASTTVLADPVGNNLFYPIEFQYLFTANSDILLDVENESDESNSYEICFHGIRLVSSMVLDGRNAIE